MEFPEDSIILCSRSQALSFCCGVVCGFFVVSVPFLSFSFAPVQVLLAWDHGERGVEGGLASRHICALHSLRGGVTLFPAVVLCCGVFVCLSILCFLSFLGSQLREFVVAVSCKVGREKGICWGSKAKFHAPTAEQGPCLWCFVFLSRVFFLLGRHRASTSFKEKGHHLVRVGGSKCYLFWQTRIVINKGICASHIFCGEAPFPFEPIIL